MRIIHQATNQEVLIGPESEEGIYKAAIVVKKADIP